MHPKHAGRSNCTSSLFAITNATRWFSRLLSSSHRICLKPTGRITFVCRDHVSVLIGIRIRPMNSFHFVSRNTERRQARLHISRLARLPIYVEGAKVDMADRTLNLPLWWQVMQPMTWQSMNSTILWEKRLSGRVLRTQWSISASGGDILSGSPNYDWHENLPHSSIFTNSSHGETSRYQL